MTIPALTTAAPTCTPGGHRMRQLVLILAGKPAAVVAALETLAARVEKSKVAA